MTVYLLWKNTTLWGVYYSNQEAERNKQLAIASPRLYPDEVYTFRIQHWPVEGTPS